MSVSKTGPEPPAASCGECVELLKARLDGELPPERAAMVDEHLASCAACREVREDFLKLSRWMQSQLAGRSRKGAFEVAQHAVLRARVLAAREVTFVRTLQRVALAAAAVLVVALGLGLASQEEVVPGWDVSARSIDTVLDVAINDPLWSEDL
ncbi:MAG TPA: zf-HC2 domain-containing protein [Planctomycetota bacterium]|nr:zf-HC2 domain-containing protein [Planctomycetota bacterium]